MEILRCPTCLNLLLDPNVKRCPACHAKLRRRSMPTVLAESARPPETDEFDPDLADRPLPLVQQELQARIEAKTARGYLKRRRAAKVARRIAALPSTVLAGDIVLNHPTAEAPEAEPKAPGEPPEIIDLPAEAMHHVSSVAEADYVPAEPVVVEPVVEPVVVEPEPEPGVEPVAESTEPEPVAVGEPEPSGPVRKRRRAPKAARIEGVLVGVEAVVEPPEPPKRKPRRRVDEVDEVAAVAHVAEPQAPAEVPEPAVARVEPEPELPEPELVPEVTESEVAGPEVAEPEVVVPEVVEAQAPPEPEVPAKPEVVESVPAVNWQPSTSAWTERVFNTSPRARQVETVTWPPRWKPADKIIDLTEDADAEQMDHSR